MSTAVTFTLNGKKQQLTVDARRTLLAVLREDLHLTGTKYGCGEGQCRACTVLMDGRAVQSCLIHMDELDDRSIETIESLAKNDALHPVQSAFLAEEAMQCGYCVPGMILTTVSLLKRKPNPTQDEIVTALNGNLCRCCGYPNILKAVQRAAQSSQNQP